MNKRSYEYRKIQANKRCLDCGTLIYFYNSERCRKCAKKLLKLDDKKCIGCGKTISYGSTGRCIKCAAKVKKSPETIKKMSEATTINMTERWKNPEFKKRVSKSVSIAIKEKYKDDKYVEKRSAGIHNYLSKMSSKLELSVFEYIKNSGYLNSIRIGRYVVDFVNNANRIIIECYGDYWHCNPNKYSPDYYCKGKKSTAKDIWESDNKRKLHLESLGYTVIVVWEYDIRKNGSNINNWVKGV